MQPQRIIHGSTHEAYSVRRLIGSGAQGTVYEGRRIRDNQRVALKFGCRDLDARRRLRQEAWAYREFSDCPFIVDLVDHNLDSSDPFLVEEFCDMGSARDRLMFLQWNQRSTIGFITHVCAALEIVQSRGCLYRDLKLGDAGLICLPGEYGAALATRNGLVGTIEYMAPELFKGGAVYSEAAEVFALGVCSCEMLFGARPKAGSVIYHGPYQTKALLQQMIAVDPSARPTITQVKNVLLSAYDEMGRQQNAAGLVLGAGLVALVVAAIWKGSK